MIIIAKLDSKIYNTDAEKIPENLADSDYIEISQEEYFSLLSDISNNISTYPGGGVITYDPISDGLTITYSELDLSGSYFGDDDIGVKLENYKIYNFVSLVNTFISENVKKYGYNSIDNAISYYNSGITAWREEAIAFNTWRDNTLSLAYDNIYGFTANGITLPSLSGFTSQQGYFEVNIPTPSRPVIF